jgi:hypothetical protein
MHLRLRHVRLRAGAADDADCPQTHKRSLRTMRPAAKALCLLALAVVALPVAGCQREARTPPITRAEALRRTEVLELRVIKVWDLVVDALDHDRDPQISHLVEVDVLSGPQAGSQLTLPLDSWNVKPPEAGSVVVIAPADWVRPARDGRTRPFGGW